MSRYLTKTLFKLGLECPNKLFYAKKKEYVNIKKEDPFLAGLAEGGFQVEELARMHYPGGVLIEGNDNDHKHLWEETQELLKNESVIIYEAAFLANNLFIRSDILVKSGTTIELIEVKSKSFRPDDEYLFIGKRGGVVSKWKPYLFDVAFQKHVIQECFPEWRIKSFIMMADKSKKSSINGLNQLFRISQKEKGRTGIVKKVTTLEETGNSVLGRKEVTQIVSDIEENRHKYHPDLEFQEAIDRFSNYYVYDIYAGWPTAFSSCRKCEFKAINDELRSGKRSGFKECFQKQHQWAEEDFNKPNILDVYFFHNKGGKLFDQGIFFKEQLTKEFIGLKIDPNKLSTTNRQWLQVEKENNNDLSIYVDKIGLTQEMRSWEYPLHFIDFETSTVALPFYEGMSPYEQVAFQFSHHIYNEDGSIIHEAEYIDSNPGSFPNFEFVRSLKSHLGSTTGTIFRYSDHENTILNAIYFQLQNSSIADKSELMDFIQNVTHSKKDSAIKWKGERDMVDLWTLEKNFYYNPLTKGSNSIKDVLPASLASSKMLREKYSQPIGQINLTSSNFGTDHIWLKIIDNNVVNPYDMLPPLFENWSDEQLETLISEIEDIHDGGAALTAYGKLQYTDMSKAEIEELRSALLKYCELDTLAMVMIFEHFKDLAQ